MNNNLELYGVTAEDKTFINTNPSLVSDELYQKLNNWYAANNGMCSCIKTPIQTILDFYENTKA